MVEGVKGVERERNVVANRKPFLHFLGHIPSAICLFVQTDFPIYFQSPFPKSHPAFTAGSGPPPPCHSFFPHNSLNTIYCLFWLLSGHFNTSQVDYLIEILIICVLYIILRLCPFRSTACSIRKETPLWQRMVLPTHPMESRAAARVIRGRRSRTK